jgi:hypothetical protein
MNKIETAKLIIKQQGNCIYPIIIPCSLTNKVKASCIFETDNTKIGCKLISNSDLKVHQQRILECKNYLRKINLINKL